MTIPKEALLEAITWWPIDAGDRVPTMLQAAIPVAELYEEAVELLKKVPTSGEDILDWIGKKDILLTQLEALK